MKIYLSGDVPGGNMIMFKDSSMKYVACLVRRFLQLSPDHSLEDFNNVRVFQAECFASLQEDINILDFHYSIRITITKAPKIKLED